MPDYSDDMAPGRGGRRAAVRRAAAAARRAPRAALYTVGQAMGPVIPPDNRSEGDTGHVEDHNGIAAILALLTGTAPGTAPNLVAALQALTGGTPTQGQVLLGTTAGAAGWNQPARILVPPSGDTSGVADTANLTAAYALYGSSASVDLCAGVYYLKSVSLDNSQSLRGTGSNTVINGVTAGPTLSWHGSKSGAAWGTNTSDFSGEMSHFELVGPGSSVHNAIGLDVGDGIDFDLRHVSIHNYCGIGGIGLHINNSYNAFFTERSHFSAWIQNCATCVVHDVTSSAQWSQEFNIFDFVIQMRCTDDGAPTNQNGVLMQGGAWLRNGEMRLRGNCSTSATQSGSTGGNGASVLSLQGGSASNYYSHISNSWLGVQIESDNSRTYGPTTVNMGTNNFISQSAGILSFNGNFGPAIGSGGGNFQIGAPIFGDSTLVSNNSKPTGWL
jgi:hypothetical protein